LLEKGVLFIVLLIIGVLYEEFIGPWPVAIISSSN